MTKPTDKETPPPYYYRAILPEQSNRARRDVQHMTKIERVDGNILKGRLGRALLDDAVNREATDSLGESERGD